MARIYQRSKKTGGIWYLDYCVEGRRVRRKIGRSKRLAELALADTQVKLERKELGFGVRDKTLAVFIREYLEYSKSNKSPSSYLRDIQILRHLSENIRVDKLASITAPKLESYKTHRQEQGAKPSTINREFNTIKAMLNKAVAWGSLSGNPARTVKKFRETKRQVRFLSPEEIKSLVSAAKDRMRFMIMTFLYTGLRRNELINLTWNDLDFRQKLLIVQSKEGWNPKDYEVRHIPLNERLLNILGSLNKNNSRYIFSNKNGERLIGNVLTRDFRKLAKSCGIKNASIHTLRHTFASYLVMNGVDVYTVQKLLGHSSIKTTEIYAHMAPDYLKSAVSRLSFGEGVQQKKLALEH
ncbi:MAG: tyrosine-type recombinase/integrase [bacterium]